MQKISSKSLKPLRRSSYGRYVAHAKRPSQSFFRFRLSRQRSIKKGYYKWQSSRKCWKQCSRQGLVMFYTFVSELQYSGYMSVTKLKTGYRRCRSALNIILYKLHIAVLKSESVVQRDRRSALKSSELSQLSLQRKEIEQHSDRQSCR